MNAAPHPGINEMEIAHKLRVMAADMEGLATCMKTHQVGIEWFWMLVPDGEE